MKPYITAYIENSIEKLTICSNISGVFDTINIEPTGQWDGSTG